MPRKPDFTAKERREAKQAAAPIVENERLAREQDVSGLSGRSDALESRTDNQSALIQTLQSDNTSQSSSIIGNRNRIIALEDFRAAQANSNINYSNRISALETFRAAQANSNVNYSDRISALEAFRNRSGGFALLTHTH